MGLWRGLARPSDRHRCCFPSEQGEQLVQVAILPAGPAQGPPDLAVRLAVLSRFLDLLVRHIEALAVHDHTLLLLPMGQPAFADGTASRRYVAGFALPRTPTMPLRRQPPLRGFFPLAA